MSYQDEAVEIETRFNTQWASTTPVAWENTNYVPNTGETFVALRIMPATGTQPSIGDPGSVLYRFSGVIMVSVYTPKDQGAGAARQLADQAAEVFRGWSATISTGQSILCRAPYIMPGDEIEDWFQLNVVIPYQRDEIYT